MVVRKNAPQFGHPNPHTHSQSIISNLPGQSHATAGSILEAKGYDVISVRPGESLHTVARTMKSHGIGSVLVRDQNGQLLGILTERDMVTKFADQPDENFALHAEDVMTRNVETATSGTLLMDLLHAMTTKRCRHIPIVDGTHVAGVLSIGDVVKFRLAELEAEALQMKQMIVG